jgi:multidrug resistance efflux pump
MAQTKTSWLIGIIVVAACGLGLYLYISSKYVYIDQSVIEAPVISLSPSSSDILQQTFVQDGDTVTVNQPVACVGDEIVKSQVNGIMVSVNQNIGQFENALAGQGVVATMIDPTQLRVLGHIDEDKGLESIKVGDVAKFTVDAFGSKTYYGVVDQISQTSTASATSNIFNQRPTDQFDIYVRFNPVRYPELKSGMSARLWIYK